MGNGGKRRKFKEPKTQRETEEQWEFWIRLGNPGKWNVAVESRRMLDEQSKIAHSVVGAVIEEKCKENKAECEHTIFQLETIWENAFSAPFFNVLPLLSLLLHFPHKFQTSFT